MTGNNGTLYEKPRLDTTAVYGKSYDAIFLQVRLGSWAFTDRLFGL
jgi:hypothetical protein